MWVVGIPNEFDLHDQCWFLIFPSVQEIFDLTDDILSFPSPPGTVYAGNLKGAES